MPTDGLLHTPRRCASAKPQILGMPANDGIRKTPLRAGYGGIHRYLDSTSRVEPRLDLAERTGCALARGLVRAASRPRRPRSASRSPPPSGCGRPRRRPRARAGARPCPRRRARARSRRRGRGSPGARRRRRPRRRPASVPARLDEPVGEVAHLGDPQVLQHHRGLAHDAGDGRRAVPRHDDAHGPMHSAVRAIAPRLRGSVMPSSATIGGPARAEILTSTRGYDAGPRHDALVIVRARDQVEARAIPRAARARGARRPVKLLRPAGDEDLARARRRAASSSRTGFRP